MFGPDGTEVANACGSDQLTAMLLSCSRRVLARQILRRQHAELVQLLGKTSARATDKLAALAEMGFETVDRLGYCSLAGISRHIL